MDCGHSIIQYDEKKTVRKEEELWEEEKNE